MNPEEIKRYFESTPPPQEVAGSPGRESQIPGFSLKAVTSL